MALQSSGQISLNDVNVELGNSGTATINMNSSDVRTLFGVSSGQISLSDGYGASNVPPMYGDRGVTGGGGYFENSIQYYTISQTNSAADFGNLTVARYGLSSMSNGSRGVFGAGAASSTSYVMDYITFSTTGNATNFGNATYSANGRAGCSDGSRGCSAGGQPVGGYHNAYVNTIEYITISTTGNASDFGDLVNYRWNLGSTSSDTRGIWYGGAARNNADYGTNTIDYVTIQTTGNASDFGDLFANKTQGSGTSDGERGVLQGNYAYFSHSTDGMEYITIATTGNGTDFGDMINVKQYTSATSNGTRGIWSGANDANMEYITIATTGNATNWGANNYTESSTTAMSGE